MSELVERMLIAIQSQLATLNQRVADVQEDQKSMREQVDVIVYVLLKLDRSDGDYAPAPSNVASHIAKLLKGTEVAK